MLHLSLHTRSPLELYPGPHHLTLLRLGTADRLEEGPYPREALCSVRLAGQEEPAAVQLTVGKPCELLPGRVFVPVRIYHGAAGPAADLEELPAD